MKQINKRITSLLLTIVMLVGMIPVPVFATEVSDENPWSGKSAVFVGDSITAGSGTTTIYYQYLKEALGFGSVTAMGVAGSCISASSDYGEANQPLINRYGEIPSADLIVVFMGTNDYGHETPLGSATDTQDGTFYGALNVIIPALVADHPSSQIVFVTPLHRYGFGTSGILGTAFASDSDPNGVGATLGDYVTALKTVCANNGVSVIDLYTECTLDPSDAAVREQYMPDGLHPNAAGHELIAEIMESHIRGYSPVEAAPDPETQLEEEPETQPEEEPETQPEEETELIYGNKFASGYDEQNRASSRINYYLKAGTVITLKDSVAMQWACAKTSDENTSDNLGYFPDEGWSDQETATVEADGWVGFVFKYRDETQTFDLSKPLSDYVTIEEPHTHSYTTAVTAPTCTEQGYTTYTCACGDSYVADEVDATGHSSANGVCTVCGVYEWDTDGDGVLEILAIGNSFSVDALEYAYQIAQNLGIEEIAIGNLYIGGCTLATHAANAAGDLGKYTYYYNDNGAWTSTGSYKISTALESRSWDYISMQQASGYSGVESTYNEELTNLIAYVQDRSDAKLVWHMTWAYQQDSTHSAFPTYGSDQMIMYNAIVSAVQNKIVTNNDFDLIVPNGTAVQNSRTSLLGDTTTRDGYHMSYDYGRYLTGLLFVKTITGLSVGDITYVPSGVDAEEKLIAIESVNNASAKPFEVTQSAYVKVEPEIPDEGYVLLQPKLYKGGYWKPTDSTNYNTVITTATNSSKYYATIRFTQETLPIGSIIILEDGWQYRPDGWIMDAVQSSRADTTTQAYTVVTEEWWGDYTIRGFNISKVGLPSLENVTEEEVRSAFQIYVPEDKHTHVYTTSITTPTCTERGYTTYTCACGDSYVDDYVDVIGHDVDTDRLYNTIAVNPGQLLPEGTVVENEIYGYIVNYPLKKGHVLSVSDTSYVFSVRKLVDGNYSTLLKQATTDSFTATEDMMVGMLIRKPDKSALTAEELANIVIYDSQYGMIGVEGYAHRFTVEAETIDGGTATTRAAIFLPDSYAETGEPTKLIIMTNGGSAYLTESSWQGNTELNRNLVETYLQNGYAVLVNDNTAGKIVNSSGEMVPDLGCLQQLSGLMKSYEYVCNALNLERQFSIHARSQGTFVGIRIMREYPELVKCALITGPNVSAAHRWTVITNKDHTAKRFGFADLTGNTFEADKFVGNDIYTDMAADDYSLPPTFWMESNDDVCPNNNKSIYEVVERLRELGCTAEYQKFSDLTHSETCRLASEEATAAALAFLKKYQESHTHSYTTNITAPTCTEQGYTTYSCTTCGGSYVADYVDAAGHQRANGTCAVCGDTLQGKKVSILSASTSTYVGVSNNTADNSTIGNNDVYYTEGRHDVYLKDTWWQQTIDALGMELLVNNSWSGSCVFMPRKGEASVGYGDRAINLHNDHTGEEPDVIFVYLGGNDFAYYKDTFGKAADVDYSALIQANGDGTFTYSAPTTTCEAYAIMLHKVQTRYPEAEIYCMTSTARRDPDYADNYADTGQPTEYSAELMLVAKHFDFPIIDLETCIPKEAELFDQYMGDKRAHPNALGMDQITNEVLSVVLGREAEIRHVTSKQGVVAEQAVLLGGSYCVDVELQDGCFIVVTMDGKDVTTEVYKDGKITISDVTGDISVATNRQPMSFRWEIVDSELISVGAFENPLELLEGAITNGEFNDCRYALTTSVNLKHDLPWVIEWKCAGDWRAAIFSSNSATTVAGAYYLTRTKGGQLCFGTRAGTQYDNYAVDISYLDDQMRTFRLENRIASDGSNMVWVYVDGTEIGPMNNYYVGSNSQNTTSDWISGKDFSFSYMGTESNKFRNCQLEFLQVIECTHSYANGVCTECGTEEPSGSSAWPSINADLTHIICYGQSFSNGSDAPIYPDPAVEGVYVYGSITDSRSGTALSSIPATGTQHPIISAVNALSTMLTDDGIETDIIVGSYGTGGRTIAQLMSSERQAQIKAEEGYTYDINSSGRYEVFSGSVASIADYAETNGKSVSCPAIVYLQGETDQNTDQQLGYPDNPDRAGYGAGGDKEKYKEYMTRLKEDMQREVMEAYGQTEKPLFLIYQVSGTYVRTQYSSINMAQLEFAQENEDVILIQTPYFTPHYTNSHHLTVNGYRWLGEYIGQSLHTALTSKTKTWPILPQNITVEDAKTLRISVSGAVNGLCIDTWTVEDATNSSNRYGFYLVLDGTRVVPKTVAAEGNDIVLTLPDGGYSLHNATTGYIYYGGQGAKGTGNIRDNSDKTGFYQYLDDSNDTGTGNNQGVSYSALDENGSSLVGQNYPLYNWLASFCYEIDLPEPEVKNAAVYHWEMQESSLVSIVNGLAEENTLTLVQGSIEEDILKSVQYGMEKTVVLYHDRPWFIEWKSAGNGSSYGGGKIFCASDDVSSAVQYLYMPADSRGFLAWGIPGESRNYGIKLKEKGIDIREEHTYKIENRISEDGTNTVYLWVDGVEIGDMNTPYSTKDGSLIEETKNWANGTDIYLNYMGEPTSFLLNNLKLSYLKISEDGHEHVYTTSITTPTCTERGYTTYTCACGDSYVNDYVDAAGHSYTNGVCTECGDINITWEIGTIAAANGANSVNSTRLRTIEYLALEDFSGVSVNMGYQLTWLAYDTDKNYIGNGTTGFTGYWQPSGQNVVAAEIQKIYSDAVYFRVALKSVSGSTMTLDDVQKSGVAFVPFGEALPEVKYELEYESFVNIGSWQDGAIWNGKLFVLGSTGTGAVYDIETLTRLSELSLDGADVLKPHANSVCFGSTYYAPDDQYPLLYVNIYNNYASAKDRMEGTCCVYRISETDGSFTTELVQVIEIGFTEDLTLWKSQENDGDVRPYGNFLVDTDKNKLYAYVMRDANKTTRFFCFDLPKLTDGTYSEVYGCNVVTLESTDIEKQFDTEYFKYLQGGTYSSGMIVSAEGFTSGGSAEPAVRIIDLQTQTVTASYYMANSGLTAEPEVICVDPDSGLLYYVAADGVLRILTISDVHFHSYTNGTCTGCGAEHPDVANYAGKVISIMGASTSTFDGYIPVADGFNLKHRARYPDTSRIPDVTDVNQTWWMQIINTLDAKLGINESWAGSRVLNTLDTNSGDLGPDAAMASLTRIQNLGSNGTPDLILFYASGNDVSNSVPLKDFDPAVAPTEVDLTSTKWDTFTDAYTAAIMRMQHFYPDSQLVVMLYPYIPTFYPNARLDRYNDVILDICAHYGVPTIDMRNITIPSDLLPDGVHPNAEGMDLITEYALAQLLGKGYVTAGENVVHTVTHKLTNAAASRSYYKGVSAGNAFEETLDGEGLTVTVTMGGVDITDSCYADGKISIEKVSGDLVITAKAAFNADGHLQQLPDVVCAGTNLWQQLEPENIYYTADGWGNNSNSNYSVTFPIAAGDRVWATCFGAAGTNGYSANGVRITWFNENGVLESVAREDVYAEFAEHGYVTAPEGAVAVNIPMISNADTWEIYLLNREHVYTSTVTAPTCTEQGYTTYTCDICGNSYVVDYVDAAGHDWTLWQQIAEMNCQGQGRWMRSCETCAAEQCTTDQDGSCVSFNSPAILTNSGDTVVLAYYDVALGADTVAEAASIVWSSDQLTIDQGCVTPAEPGVYPLIASSGTVSKTVYLVVKNPGDTEYVLYFDDFTDATLTGYRPIEVSSGAQYYVSDGKLILDAGNSAQSYIRILLPGWIGDFGDYEISTTFTMTEALDSTKWFAVMARVQDEDYPYLQAPVRFNATAANGIELDQKNEDNNWVILHKTSYTEAISPSKYYTQTFGLSGTIGYHAINGATLLESDSMAYGPGDVGFQVRGAIASIDSIKIVIPVDTTAHTFGDWAVTAAPTCTEPGTETRSCSVCGYSETREAVPSHDLVQHEEKMHNCTESGWLAYEVCTRCDYSTLVEVAPTAHSYQRRIHSIAHRGYSQTAPENTLAAYELAKQLGYFYVECDVSFTADGIPVLLHDDTIDRTSDGSGQISDLTYEQLLQYDFGGWKSDDFTGTRIPTFEEFVALCAELELSPYIELKNRGSYSQEKVQQLVDIVEAYGMTGKVTWISFSDTFLGYVKNIDPGARLGYIYSGDATESVFNTAKKLQTGQNDVFLLLNYSKITNTGILRAAANGFAIEVWTVNSESAILALPSYVSGVISDKLNAHSILVDSGITVTAPTCTEQGYTTYTCSACGDSYVADNVAATGHTEVTDASVQPTMHKTGLSAGSHCDVCGTVLTAQEEIPARGYEWMLEDGEFKILLIGNSFSEDASNGSHTTTSQMLDILQAMLGEDVPVTVGLCYSGGKGLNWHATQSEQGNSSYSLRVISSESGKWKSYGSYTSADALTWTDWDVVSLQHYEINTTTGKESNAYPSQVDPKFDRLEPATEFMLDYVDQYAPNAAVYFYMHWARAYKSNLNESLATYNKMAAFFPEVLDYTGTESKNRFETIIPVGLSVQNARTTYLALLSYNTTAYADGNLNLTTDAQIGLQRDGGHLTFNVGRYIAALTFAEMIIPEEMRSEGYTLPEIRITESVGKLPEEYTEIAQKSVFAAVDGWKDGSLAVTEIEGYTVDPTVAEAERLAAVELNISCAADVNDLNERILAAAAATVSKDFSVDAVALSEGFALTGEAQQTIATLSIRFGYTSVQVELDVNIGTHSYESVITVPTCTEQGYTTYTCSACGDSYVADNVATLGHDEVSHAAKAATCTEIGWVAYVTCGRCDYSTYAEKAALGHDEVKHDAKAPTCTETGWAAYVTCSRCDYSTYAEKAALGHDEVKHDAKAPTCTEIGWAAYVTCSRCDYSTYAEKAALGHDEVSHAAQAPTCTEIGWATYVTCTRCDYSTYAEKSALGHDEVKHDAKAPTCTEIGWDAYVTCSRCDYSTYAEKAALGHDEVSHAAQAPTCTEIGWAAYVTCTRCDYSTYAEKSALGHDEVKHDAKAPTCTEIGWDAYVTCSRCDYSTYAEKAALGHDEVSHAAKAATCTAIGWDAYVTCSRCDYSTYAEKAALGHDEVKHAAKAATCTAIGWAAYVTCSRCDYSTYVEKAALGHAEVSHAAKAPTCTEIGWDAYVTCSRCDYSTYVEKSALGHDEVSHAAKAPTCTGIGWAAYVTCSRCNYSTYTEKTALGHTEDAAVVENETAATCTTAGSYDSVVYCTECSQELSRETVTVPATDHNDVDGDGKCDACGGDDSVVLLGDINGDGVIDGRDVVRLARFLGEVSGAEIHEKNADVNADDVVDGRDIIRLARFMAEDPGVELG